MLNQQLLVAVFVGALLFCIYLYVQRTYWKRDEVYEGIPGQAPEVEQPMAEPDQRVTAGGPNTPNQAPPPSHERLPGPTDSDPYVENYESSAAEENLRHPERLFGPAKTPDVTEYAENSGVASSVTAGVSQTFSPEFAQNGGEFIGGGIFANDLTDKTNFAPL